MKYLICIHGATSALPTDPAYIGPINGTLPCNMRVGICIENTGSEIHWMISVMHFLINSNRKDYFVSIKPVPDGINNELIIPEDDLSDILKFDSVTAEVLYKKYDEEMDMFILSNISMTPPEWLKIFDNIGRDELYLLRYVKNNISRVIKKYYKFPVRSRDETN